MTAAAIICLLTITIDTEAACPDLSDAQPARLVDSAEQKKLVAELIPRWKSDEKVRMVKFGSYVTAEGNLRATCCASATHTMTAGAYRKLGRKLGRLRFVPASHNGEKLRVYVGFIIVATKTENRARSILLMNQMLSIDSFGLNYTAPQRIWTDSMWPASNFIVGDTYAEITVHVSKTGNASNASVSKRNVSALTRDQHFVAELEGDCFIPGFVDGVAVDMPYSEAFAGF